MTTATVHAAPIPADRPGPAVWLMGAHGGAGVSTLAHYLSFTGDSDEQWPCGTDVENESTYVVMVARETDYGLKKAHARLIQHREENLECELLGLITVANSPTLDKSVRQYREVVKTATAEHWRIDWHKFLPATSLPALPRWHPLDGVPEQTKGARAAVPKDVIDAGVGIVTAIQRSLPHLRSGH